MTWSGYEGTRPAVYIPKVLWGKFKDAIDLRNQHLRPGQKPYSITSVILALVEQYVNHTLGKY